MTYINLSGDRSGEKLCCEGAMSREIVEKVSQYARREFKAAVPAAMRAASHAG